MGRDVHSSAERGAVGDDHPEDLGAGGRLFWPGELDVVGLQIGDSADGGDQVRERSPALLDVIVDDVMRKLGVASVGRVDREAFLVAAGDLDKIERSRALGLHQLDQIQQLVGQMKRPRQIIPRTHREDAEQRIRRIGCVIHAMNHLVDGAITTGGDDLPGALLARLPGELHGVALALCLQNTPARAPFEHRFELEDTLGGARHRVKKNHSFIA